MPADEFSLIFLFSIFAALFFLFRCRYFLTSLLILFAAFICLLIIAAISAFQPHIYLEPFAIICADDADAR